MTGRTRFTLGQLDAFDAFEAANRRAGRTQAAAVPSLGEPRRGP